MFSAGRACTERPKEKKTKRKVKSEKARVSKRGLGTSEDMADGDGEKKSLRGRDGGRSQSFYESGCFAHDRAFEAQGPGDVKYHTWNLSADIAPARRSPSQFKY